MDFCAWKNLIQYNKIVLVDIFWNRLNKGLAKKLVELGQLNEISLLNIWYIKIIEFKRARWLTEKMFGQKRQFIKKKKITQEKIKKGDRLDLVVLRQDPDVMDIDMIKRQEMYFNCGVKDYITIKCLEPRKEKKFLGKRTKLKRSVKEKPKEGFGENREWALTHLLL